MRDQEREYRPTLRLKNVRHLTSYNIEIREPILIMFGKIIIEQISIQTTVYFPSHLTKASALGLPGKTRNTRIARFH